MAPSCLISCTALLALTVGVVAAAPAAPTASPPAPGTPASQLPIKVDAASSDVDYKTNTVNFRDVTISQGATRVQADHARATGLNFGNSRWTFTGNVRIDAEQRGSLRSDEAIVEFHDEHIARATITGKPAQFEQARNDSAAPARGHAGQIVYDINDGTVRLSDDAWLSDGKSEIAGPELIYNIRGQRVQAAAAPDGSQRVHITIDPRSGTIIDKDKGVAAPRGSTDPGSKQPPATPPAQPVPRPQA